MLAMHKTQCGLRLLKLQAELNLGRKSVRERLRSESQPKLDKQSRPTI